MYIHRKTICYLLAAFLITVLVASMAIAHGDLPDVITIDKAQAKKAPVVFPHEEHSSDIECAVCHHATAKEEKPKSCFECHGINPNAPDPSIASQKENPFHIRCKGCHKEQAKGPTKCAECHKE